MNIYKCLVIFFIIIITNIAFAQDQYPTMKISQLNDVEQFQCQGIKTAFNDFQYSKKVIRYDIDENNQFVEMVFEKDQNGKYFGKFNEYYVTFKEGSDFYRYKEVIRNIFQREGTIFITAIGVIKSERVCNKNVCEMKVFKGKKLLFNKKDN